MLAGSRRGDRPDLAITMVAGLLDELLALHEGLGLLATAGALPVERERHGLPDRLRLRTLAALRFVDEAAVTSAVGTLFQEPALLPRLGSAPVQIRARANGRHRHPGARHGSRCPAILRRYGKPCGE